MALTDPDDRLAIGDTVMVRAIVAVHARTGGPIVVGLSGAQGSGKSTTACRLAGLLAGQGLETVVRSIDDFYRTRAERERLAATVHSLLKTRGVPGTHDVPLIFETIASLKAGGDTCLPVFDKTIDDRLDRAEWPVHRGRVDIVLIEGWCVGAGPEPADRLIAPINDLEREEDRDGRWRHYVNDRLADDYAELRASFDLHLMVRAPDFGCVRGWRAEQEARLDRRPGAAPPMDSAALDHFIAHYERITRWMLEDEPADLIADLDARRMPTGWRLPHLSSLPRIRPGVTMGN